MSYRARVSKLVSPQALCLVLVASLVGVGLLFMPAAYGDQLPTRSLELTNGIANKIDTYTFSFTIPNSETLGSIDLKVCDDGPILGTPCTSPPGFDFSNATLTTQTGVTDFSIGSKTANEIVLTRTASVVPAGQVSYVISNVHNPTENGSYFARVQTFVSTDASGAGTDYGGLAYSVTFNLSVTTVVPPYLYFCVGVVITNVDCTTATGDQLNFGDFTTSTASTAQTQMVAATNADTGYAITMDGTTLTSGNNIIPALTTPDVSRPGVSQFGVNLVANQAPQAGENPSGNGVGAPVAGYNQANKFKFGDDDIVASVPAPDEERKYTTTYLANISKDQAAGIYVSTLTYVATAGF